MSLLTGNWLRAASRSLRDRHPSVYSRLNRFRNRILSHGTNLAAYQAKAIRRFAALLPDGTRDLNLLEVGSDSDGAVLRALATLGAAEVLGVNPAPEIWAEKPIDQIRLGERVTLHRADVRALPFEDCHFDAVFSVATFEHIIDLPRALAEMHRVLRPGGFVYTSFGPIWSSARGHHVRARVGDLVASHYEPTRNPLPDFSHLLLSPEQTREALLLRCSPSLIEPIVEWVFVAQGINRLFFHDYLDILLRSPFHQEYLRTERDKLDPQLRALLHFRYPRETDFEITNIELLLRR